MSFDTKIEMYGLTAGIFAIEVYNFSNQVVVHPLTAKSDMPASIRANCVLRTVWTNRWNFPLWF